MATRGRSAPRGAQVVAPAGAGDRRRPVGVGGCTGWSRDVREAAVEKGSSSAPARTPGPEHTPQVKGGGRGEWGRGHSQVRGVLLADVLLQDAGVYVGGLQGPIDVVACRGGPDVSTPRSRGPAL